MIIVPMMCKLLNNTTQPSLSSWDENHKHPYNEMRYTTDIDTKYVVPYLLLWMGFLYI